MAKSATGSVLVVDDDPEIRSFLQAGLAAFGFRPAARASAEEALTTIAGDPECDVVLSDLKLPGSSGLELCQWLHDRHPSLPVVVMTAYGDLDTARTAIQAGAYDFVSKPLDLDALKLTLERALAHRKLKDEVVRLRNHVATAPGFDELVGASAAMCAVYDLIERIRGSDASVLITGESGTGKELVAHALHRTGKRAAGPFVAVNCAAIPEALLESELFGHAKGAFTDARSRRAGLMAQASGGTLFLDEIGDMPLALQPKLLRALQDRRLRPVGGDVEVPFDARFIAATHRDIYALVQEGRFREDLFFRLDVVHLTLPPLRSRGGDVMLLAERFLAQLVALTDKRVTGFSEAAAKCLVDYAWPGNVRELRNAVERAVALARHTTIEVDDLPERVQARTHDLVEVVSDDPRDLLSLDQMEQRYIRRVLGAVGGNKSVAARILGVDRKTLYRKLGRDDGPK